MKKKLVCYADDSYDNKQGKLCIALVCLHVESAESGADKTLYDLLRKYQLVKYHQKKGEIKGREFFKSDKFKEIGSGPFCKWFEELDLEYACDKAEFTLENKQRLLKESVRKYIGLRNHKPSLIISDVNIINTDRLRVKIGKREITIMVKSRNSEKVGGIQIADIIAYYYAHYVGSGQELC